MVVFNVSLATKSFTFVRLTYLFSWVFWYSKVKPQEKKVRQTIYERK